MPKFDIHILTGTETMEGMEFPDAASAEQFAYDSDRFRAYSEAGHPVSILVEEQWEEDEECDGEDNRLDFRPGSEPGESLDGRS